MELITKMLFQNSTIRRIFIFSIIGVILFLAKDMLNIFLLTFIITYLIHSAQKFVTTTLKLSQYVKQKVMIVMLYFSVVVLMVLFIYKYAPLLVNESISVVKQVIVFYNDYSNRPHESQIEKILVLVAKEINIDEYMGKSVDFILKSLTNIGTIGFNIFMASILSLFFLLEKNKIIKFTKRIKFSKLKIFYEEIEYFGVKFLHSFGKVIQAQILIALINAVLSVVALFFMNFPHILGLGVMIFVLSLMPVAGTIVSLFPLSYSI